MLRPLVPALLLAACAAGALASLPPASACHETNHLCVFTCEEETPGSAQFSYADGGDCSDTQQQFTLNGLLVHTGVLDEADGGKVLSAADGGRFQSSARSAFAPGERGTVFVRVEWDAATGTRSARSFSYSLPPARDVTWDGPTNGTLFFTPASGLQELTFNFTVQADPTTTHVTIPYEARSGSESHSGSFRVPVNQPKWLPSFVVWGLEWWIWCLLALLLGLLLGFVLARRPRRSLRPAPAWRRAGRQAWLFQPARDAAA